MSVATIEQLEKLGSFYLGRQYEIGSGPRRDELVMYEAKDLCTHALCVGMTGSGKTGLCLALLEEAAIDGIPSICIDPKGDLANLLLTFPQLRPADFKPWLEPSAATAKGLSLDDYAAEVAQRWQTGLLDSHQTPDRIQRLRDACDVAIYTPGSSAGLSLTVLKSFNAPPPSLLADDDAMRERLSGSVSGLLSLLGTAVDPTLSPEAILLSTILEQAWQQGRDLALADFVGLIQRPPINRVGVIDIDRFMPPADRNRLAMQLNNLLASPTFAGWLEGEPLSIHNLLWTADGRPRQSILSIAHLNDSQRMFFVTMFLNELVAWMRTQSGTSALRAILYMDEIYGYFPPSAKPPTKPPMLTLLKQARAFGLGIVLATQNPVDLDYKGLSNIGTWFLGRLQTQRDQARVLDGLQGASSQSGASFDRDQISRTLSALKNRVFLMNNVHDQAPTVFEARWVMSYLAGPLAREQIKRLMGDRKTATLDRLAAETTDAKHTVNKQRPTASKRPAVPTVIDERFVVARRPLSNEVQPIYQPALWAKSSLHFVRANAKVDQWVEVERLLPAINAGSADGWLAANELASATVQSEVPQEGFSFAPVPDDWLSDAKLKSLATAWKEHLYRAQTLEIYKCEALGCYAPAGLTREAARQSFERDLREARDCECDKVREKFMNRVKTLERRIQQCGDRLSREQSELRDVSLTSAINIGSTIVGAFFGKRRGGAVQKASTAMRTASRSNREHEDVQRARESLQQCEQELQDLNNELRLALDEVAAKFDLHRIELTASLIAPRKADLKCERLCLLWMPWEIDASGRSTALF